MDETVGEVVSSFRPLGPSGRFDKEYDMAGVDDIGHYDKEYGKGCQLVGDHGGVLRRVRFLFFRRLLLHEEDEEQCHCRQHWPHRQRDRRGSLMVTVTVAGFCTG